jgi:integrase
MESDGGAQCAAGRWLVPVVKLTARNVMALPAPESGRADYVDDSLPGFGLRVTAANVRTFVVRYFREAKARRYTIGRTPPLSLADAREIARRVLADTIRGSDPQAEKLAARQKHSQRTQTFGALCERFLAEARTKDNLPLRQTTLYNWRNIAKVEILPALGARAPEEITRRQVRDFVEAIADERPYWANRVFELVRRVFSWAVEKDLIIASPCVGLKKPGGERPRDRVLSSEEIRAVWAALEGEALFGDAVRLLFYTAARPREVLRARWDEIDREDGLWRIPSSRMKNREPHVVPLSAGAMDILERRRAANPEAEYVFPSPTLHGPWVASAKPTSRIRRRADVEFQLRDVRRTVRTRLREMGAPQDVSEAILSHSRPRLIRTYDRYQPVPEMRAALDTWGSRLSEIVSGSTAGLNVVRLRRN